MKTVSYFTPSYRIDALALRQSAELLNVELDLTCLPAEMGWKAAVMWKPTFISQMMARWIEYDGILYTDADSVFRRRPGWDSLKDADFAYHKFRRSQHHNEEILTGTLFLANTPFMAEFVGRWIEETRNYAWSDTPEQDSLKKTLESSPEPKVKDFGPEYCWIYDDFPPIYGKKDVVIEHFQASRTKKPEIGKTGSG